MASKQVTVKKIVLDNETVVTNYGLITARTLNTVLTKKLPEWTKNRKNDKIMIICGAHGKPDGSLDGWAEHNSLKSLKVSISKYLVFSLQRD